MKGFNFLYTLVFFSGMSGLIYEVVWHRYLSILLGAQARATAIILSIFLGGMCVGFHLFGKFSRKRDVSLLRTYAILELGLGLWAFLFPFLFKFTFNHMGDLYSFLGIDSFLVDFGVSIFLLGFPTVLMGGTLPLLTQAASQSFEGATRVHSRIYGMNTLGACLGCFLTNYLFIPQTSLSFAVIVGGTINLLVALFSYEVLPRFLKCTHSLEGTDSPPIPVSSVMRPLDGVILGISALSGFYILTLQTCLIRLMGLSAGSSNYNFGLVVGVFIFSLAIGSLSLSLFSRIYLKSLLYNQLFVALFLFLILLSGNYFPYVNHLIRLIVRTAPENFIIYQIILIIALGGVLFIPLYLCGMTLPLCFHLIKDRPETLGSRVGQLYSLNTLGCVVGGLGGGYFFYSYFDIEGLLKLCIYAALIGFFMLWLFIVYTGQISKVKAMTLILSAAGILSFSYGAPPFRKDLYAQAFRNQFPLRESYLGVDEFAKRIFGKNKYLFYKDGPDASIGIAASYHKGEENSRTLFMNGKSDGNTYGDRVTMQMTGFVPALLSRKLDRSCVIGFGTGTTIGAVQRVHPAGRVDVVEISKTLLEQASLFDKYNWGVSKNPNTHFFAMDAFRFLEGAKERYDLIISEPSTLWLSGVENLYTEEFYSIAKAHLNSGGLLAQWVQAYAFNEPLFRMVLNTLSRKFHSVRVFQLRNYDLLLVASDAEIGLADLERTRVRLEDNVSVQGDLEALGIHGIESLLALEKMTPALVRAAANGAGVQTLQAPRLSSGAAKSFFTAESVDLNAFSRSYNEFFLTAHQSLLRIYLQGKDASPAVLANLYRTYCESLKGDFYHRCAELIIFAAWENSVPSKLEHVMATLAPQHRSAITWLLKTEPHFDVSDLEQLKTLSELYRASFSPMAPLRSEKLKGKIQSCLRKMDYKSEVYGACLLEEIKFSEVTGTRKRSEVLTSYFDWFQALPLTSPSYDQYARLNEIFQKEPSLMNN